MDEAKEQFCTLQSKLLAVERLTELDEISLSQKNYSPKELERKGLALLGLHVVGIKSSIGGKQILELLKGPGVSSIHLKAGEIIELRCISTIKHDIPPINPTGVVYRTRDNSIFISLSEAAQPEDLQERYNLFKVANDVAYKRMTSAIERLRKADGSHLHSCLFGSIAPRFSKVDESIQFFDQNMDDSQRDAIRFAISAQDIALIHGPPGTGKTCVELVRQLVHGNPRIRILMCGPSNISVDNMVERLAGKGIDIVRVGHTARVLYSVLDHTLEARTWCSDEGRVVNDVRNELDQSLKILLNTKKLGERRRCYLEIKELRKELKSRETRVVSSIMRNAKVVLCTLNGGASSAVYNVYRECGSFDVVLIDEATQALEAECWIAILKSRKVVLVGDHKQLGPTVKSKHQGTPNLEVTLFDRMLQLYGDNVKKMLNTQYRANQLIMDFSSKTFYNGLLKSHSSVQNRLLTDLKNVSSSDITSNPVIFIDTTGFELYESSSSIEDGLMKAGDSKVNHGEALLVVDQVKQLVSLGVSSNEIVIITPYAGQSSLLSNLLSEYAETEIGTVDGFQGREKECVILSLVRSNENGIIGFLADERRLNVAITRAKRCCIVIADGSTLIRAGGVIKKFVEYLEEHGHVIFPS